LRNNIKRLIYLIINMNLINQKYITLTTLFSLNILLSSLFIIYESHWYVFLFILAISSGLYSFNSIMLFFNKCWNKEDTMYDIKRLNDPKNYLYIVPCYNESMMELTNTLISIVYQKINNNDKRSIVIVCDGMVKGHDNMTTDKILLNILNNKMKPIKCEYKTREGVMNKLDVYEGIFNNINYILLIKTHNAGKRDSLVLIRKLCYQYNKLINNNLYLNNILSSIYKNEMIDYIVGIDADTIFDFNCTYELIKSMDINENIHGCVGFVDINMKMNNIFNPFILYQYAEYVFAQCLKRQAQSNITHKVNCLSGCCQILRISKETCGDEILKKFNYAPNENDNILTHIRSYASEDRNHVCLMLSMYPYVKTIQNLNAIAYTHVPTNTNIFLSQRRRWSLGANSNDILLLTLPNINFFERIMAFVNISIFTVSPFITLATAIFIKSLIINPTMLMLYLSIIMIIPFTYGIFIPIFIKSMNFRNAIYFYISYIFFILIGSIINLFIYIYSLLGMDTIKWGKTREIKHDINVKVNNNITTKEDVDYISIVDFYIDDILDDIGDDIGDDIEDAVYEEPKNSSYV
jgi:chitin synthase